jgi:hypothetical protein
MNGEVSLRANGGDDNRGQWHGETPSGSRGSAGLTCVTDSLCDLQLRTDQMFEENVSAEGLSFVDDFGWVVTGSDNNQVVTILQRCLAKSIEWASK